MCPNGKKVPVAQPCMKTCSDGNDVPEDEVCATKFCPDGTEVPNNQDCELKLCHDRRIIPVGQSCWKSCPDGTEVSSNETCPQTPSVKETVSSKQVPMRTCQDGQRVPAGTKYCPVNTKWLRKNFAIFQFTTCTTGTVIIGDRNYCPENYINV